MGIGFSDEKIQEYEDAGHRAVKERCDLLEAVVAWLTGGDTGLSSQWMLHVCCDVPFENGWNEGACPYDPSDFGRCYRLIRAIPQVKANMHKLKDSGPVWAAYIENWDQLEAAYELEHSNGDAPVLYGLMQRFRKAAEAASQDGGA